MYKQTVHKFENDKYVGSIENTQRKIWTGCFINTYGYQGHLLFFIYVYSTFKNNLRKVEAQKQCNINWHLDKLDHRPFKWVKGPQDI